MAEEVSVLVNRVLESLSAGECKALLFLISDLACGECVRDALVSLATHTPTHTHTPHVLHELLFTLNRCDLLKSVLRSSRQEVEAMLNRKGRVLSDYRVLMMDVSESLESEEFRSLSFLLSSTISKGLLNKATNFLDIVVELEKLDKISSDNLEMVEQCLRKIQRVDLANKIQSYQRGKRRLANTKPTPKPVPKPHPISQREETSHNTQFGLGLSLGHQPPVRQQQGLAEGFENLKLSVAESAAQHSMVPVDECYINSEIRVCVIIDCIGCDGESLKQTFEQLGFQVHLHSLLSSGEVCSVLRSFDQQVALQGVSVFSCCVLSRASETHLLGTDLSGPGLLLEDLRTLCPLLAGKPKLFFTQCYTCAEAPPTLNQHDPHLETDGVPYHHSFTPGDALATADVLWSVCRTQACLLERPNHRSVYLQKLSSALLRAQHRRIHVLEALLEVNRDVYEHNQRNRDEVYHVTVSHTLRKKLNL